MSPTAAWILIMMAVAAAAIIGFYTGRHTAPGKRQVDALQKELDENRQAMTDYRQSVSRHFDKTATLFTSMAGSYRELYDHLRESYGDLTDTPGRPLLPESAGALLEGENALLPVPQDNRNGYPLKRPPGARARTPPRPARIRRTCSAMRRTSPGIWKWKKRPSAPSRRAVTNRPPRATADRRTVLRRTRRSRPHRSAITRHPATATHPGGMVHPNAIASDV
jgi:uncharacterized membrane-anchored protein YhcB (DUF1043 family)